MKQITVIIVLLFSLQICLALSKVDSISYNGKKKEIHTLSEAEAYKMLYDNQVKANDSVLKTIIYALSGLGTAVLLVFASNWWFNEKKVKETAEGINTKISEAKNSVVNESNEKLNSFLTEKTKEITSVLNKLQDEMGASITSLSVKFTEFSEKTREEIRDDNQKHTFTFEDRMKSYSENFASQLKSLEERIDLTRSNLISSEASMKELINSMEKKLLRETKHLKREEYYIKGYLFEHKEYYSTAFRNFLNAANTDIEIGLGVSTYILESIKENLQKSPYIWEDEVNTLQDLLQKIEGQDEIKLTISELIKTKEIKRMQN